MQTYLLTHSHTPNHLEMLSHLKIFICSFQIFIKSSTNHVSILIDKVWMQKFAAWMVNLWCRWLLLKLTVDLWICSSKKEKHGNDSQEWTAIPTKIFQFCFNLPTLSQSSRNNSSPSEVTRIFCLDDASKILNIWWNRWDELFTTACLQLWSNHHKTSWFNCYYYKTYKSVGSILCKYFLTKLF